MPPRRRRQLRTSGRALMGYAAAWLAGGIAVALLVVAVLQSAAGDPRPRRADPLKAVTASGCVLEEPRGRAAQVSRPPVSGPPARAVADGIYARPLPRERLIGALRRGVIVIQYEHRLRVDDVERLQDAFTAPLPRRIVAPDGTGMTFKVAGTAWGKVIGCSRLDAGVIAALQRFAERYAGRGPDT